MEDKLAPPFPKLRAEELYDKAGTAVKEDPEQITIDKYNYLLKDEVHLIIQEVLSENPLPFKLQDFQLFLIFSFPKPYKNRYFFDLYSQTCFYYCPIYGCNFKEKGNPK